MEEIYKIPESFWGLFKSQNRYIYIESLILINDEYLYNDYFITRETCIQMLADHFANRLIDVSVDEIEDEYDSLEPIATRILSRLIRFGWLKKVEDYSNFKSNILIPDYSSMFIDVFKRLDDPDANETDLYIQNVYTNIYSFYHDKKAGIELLKTAMVNTSKLNRALQDLLHNMDRFFGSLLEQKNYEDLLQEHLTGYVDAIVNKKYGLLKTNDNFYIYKNDIKKLLRLIMEDTNRIEQLKLKMASEGKYDSDADAKIYEIIEGVERGIANMERRIAHIDTEHSKYVRATVSRLTYLMNKEEDRKGDVVRLLNIISKRQEDELFKMAGRCIKIHDNTILSKDSLYQKRGKRKTFEDTIEKEEQVEDDLTKDEILLMNRSKSRYSKQEIEQFIITRMQDQIYITDTETVATDKDFELLILAYDYSLRKNSPFKVLQEGNIIRNGKYTYPSLKFIGKNKNEYAHIVLEE